MKKLTLISVLVSVIFASCASMQEDIYIDSLKNDSEISSFEKQFTELDARYFDSTISEDSSWLNKSNKLLSDLESALKNVNLKKAATARLYAIAGCISFDMGSKSQAKRYYESAQEAFKGDERSLILARRLEIEKNFQEKASLFSDKSLLTLETALLYYSQSEYAKALASFDEAFLSLDSFYRTSYSTLRDTSWNLRNLTENSDKAKQALLALPKLTVMQMILITNQNPELLYKYTVGKTLTDKELYTKIAGSGLLSPVSQPQDAENAVSKNSAVTRQIAARFLWNLYNQRRNTPQNAAKYSAAYKNQKRSPVLDVKLNSPDFDAVLGCVENEIMHLEDGIEFGAEKEVSGIEFSESVGKIK